MNKAVFLIVILTISFFSFSCSYGLLNFAAETGDLEIYFEITGDNGAGVDSIVFDLSAPDGSGTVSFTYILYGNTIGYQHISRMTAGTWTAAVRLMTGSAVLQTFDAVFDIYADGDTKIDMRGSYNGTDFDITYNWYQTGSSTTAGITEPAFTVSGLYLNPAIRYNFRTDEITPSSAFHITGTGFEGNLRNLELLYPDGAVVFLGEEYYSRGSVFSNSITDSLIEITRAFQLSMAEISGSYIMKMYDYSQNGIRRELPAVYENLELKIPMIAGHDYKDTVPEYIMSSVGHTFQWALADSSQAGTILLFVIDAGNAGNIYPATDALIVQTGVSGELSLPSFAIPDGDYELIIAAVEKIFTTPITDAIAAGLSPDLRPESFAGSIRSIYGSDTGLITFSSASFTYGP